MAVTHSTTHFRPRLDPERAEGRAETRTLQRLPVRVFLGSVRGGRSDAGTGSRLQDRVI